MFHVQNVMHFSDISIFEVLYHATYGSIIKSILRMIMFKHIFILENLYRSLEKYDYYYAKSFNIMKTLCKHY